MGSQQGVLYYIGDKANSFLTNFDTTVQRIPRWKDCSPSAWIKRLVKFIINNCLGVRKAQKKAILSDKLHDGQLIGHSHMWEDTEIDINEYSQSKFYKGFKFFLQNICGVRLAKIGQSAIDQSRQNKLQKTIRYIVQNYFGFYLQNVPTKLMLNSGCSTEHVQSIRWDHKGNRARFQSYTDGFTIIDQNGHEKYISYKSFGIDAKAILQEPIKVVHIENARRLERVMCRLWPSQQRQEARQRVAAACRLNDPTKLDRFADRTWKQKAVHALWKASKDGWLARQETSLRLKLHLTGTKSWPKKTVHFVWKEAVHTLWRASKSGWLERQESIRQQAHDIAEYGRVPPPDTLPSWPARRLHPRSIEMIS